MNDRNGDSTAEDQRWRLQETVAEQLSRIAQETGGICRMGATAEGFETALEYWRPGDDDPSLRITARLNDPHTFSTDWSNRLELLLDHAGENTNLLTLAWRNGIHDAHLGLNAAGDHSEGPYAGGKALSRLRRDVQAAQQPSWRPAFRAVALRREQTPVTVIDAEFQPVAPRRESAATPVQPADTNLLREALGALPEDIAADAQNIFAHFIAASAHGGPLKPDDIAAFVQEGMAELLAFQEAHLEGKSPGTGLGVGLKGMALIGALITAIGAETTTGVFAFGPIIGHSIKALAVSSLSARNPQLAEPAQGFFQMEKATVKAKERAATAKLKLAAANERLAKACNARALYARAGRRRKPKRRCCWRLCAAITRQLYARPAATATRISNV